MQPDTSGALVYLRTPAPIYSPIPDSLIGPELRALTEGARISSAISAVQRQYTGAVRDVLLEALHWHQYTKSRVATSSLPARLVNELLRPPP